MTLHSKTPVGLDGIVAAATALSHVDGERGELIIAGHRLADLSPGSSFEEVTARLWSLSRNEPVDPLDVKTGLGRGRAHAFDLLPRLLVASEGLPVAAAFRAGVAALGPIDGLSDDTAIVGAMPVLAAALARKAEGKAPIAPDPAAGHAADTLRMLRGTEPRDTEVKALDAYLVTVSDHGMNASTFAARVVASTQADLFMSITAGYCALTGSLHGGAPEPVLAMLDAIGSRDRIVGWIDGALARGERLMGFGHRIYRVRDPRADVLRGAVALLGSSSVDLGFAAEVEAYARAALAKAKPERPLDTNVEFYTAILLDALGIPRAAFTPVFATGRAAGWTAHAREQQRIGRLLRPNSIYTGATPQ